MSNPGQSFTPGPNPTSRRTSPSSSSMAYSASSLTMQPQQHSYSNDEFALMSGYPHSAAPAPSASWGMASSPPSPINLSSSPTNAYWPPVTGSSESSYMHSSLMSGDPAMSGYYGHAPQRTITPGSPSVASTPSDAGHGRSASAMGLGASYTPGLTSSTPSQATDGLRVASTGPNRRRGVSETTDPQEYERQRMKKKDYAKAFRDNEKYHFEQLRRRLFPTDPNTRRAECLERAVTAMDELETYKARAIQREAEVAKLRAELETANRRTAELEQFVAASQANTSQAPPQPDAETYQYISQAGWR
ncbi:hypothetical protein PENSPDRAFT_651532 [Peniophora sp. CONT]|nr:hypothetical protein PENSPDRAFT_651532 [Peniophora sp. CONT]